MSKHDSFPPRTAASRGRVNLQRTNLNSSQEPLSAHPLLSPSVPQHAESNVPAQTLTPPRYVPYTPRQQRVIPTTTSPASTAQVLSAVSASPQSQGATGKLQLVNLKAAAQGLGLDTSSIGWAILERLVGSGIADEGEEWAEIWNAVTTGKATLLLPLESVSNHEQERMTPEFVKDHIILCDVPAPSSAPISGPNDVPANSASSVCTALGSQTVITLSGLRGVLDEESDTLTLRSSLQPSSKAFQSLLEPTTRSSLLNRLPPLPFLPSSHPQSPSRPQLLAPSPTSPASSAPPSPNPSSRSQKLLNSITPQHSPYPTYTLPIHSLLPLPPRPTKPALPPRPALSIARTGSPVTPTGSIGRMSGFASLFGVKSNSSISISNTPTGTPSSPIAAPIPIPIDSHSHTEGETLSSASHAHAHATIDVPAYAISRRIVRDEVGKQIMRGVKGEIGASFAEGHVPGWVAERVVAFMGDLMPLVKGTKGTEGDKGHLGSKEAGGGRGGGAGKEKEGRKAGGKYVVNTFGGGIEELSERFQEFYAGLEEELGTRGAGPGPGPIAGGDEWREAETGRARREREEDEKEARVRRVMEVVEGTVCGLFYDRLFLQPTSDDPTHDEALSSRVAALNLLDLGLEHLDVDISSVGGSGVDAVVRECGETLSRLDVTCRSPAEKAAILVAAHKVVVDGLSKLPPIKLKSGDAAKADKPPAPEIKDVPKTGMIASPLAVKTSVVPSQTTFVSSPISDVPAVVVSDPQSDAGANSPPSLAPRALSPLLTISPPPPDVTPVSGDILLPLIIFSVVKANPAHLVSHLLYTQRFRNQRVGGEESYCMINLMAVAEFLENVDLAALGLKDSEKKVISTADLTPIPLIRTPESPAFPNLPSLRGRVEQQVDAIAGSANKVLLGVVDTSFGVLRSFLPGSTPQEAYAASSGDAPPSAPWNAVKPGFGLLRRESGFSIASLAASLPGNRTKSLHGDAEEAGQQLVSVSRPGSVRSAIMDGDEETTDSEDRTEDDTGEDDDGEEEDNETDEDVDIGVGHDSRSIRSFESMLTGSARERKEASERKSLSDRLAHMPGLSRLAHSHPPKESPPSQRSSLLPPVPPNRFDSPSSSRPQSPTSIRLAPPNRRFVECHEDDLKVSEIAGLLREYKRLVEGVRAIGGFDE